MGARHLSRGPPHFRVDRPVSIAPVALIDEDGDRDRFREETFVRRFFPTTGSARSNIREVFAWAQNEYTRHGGDRTEVFEVATRGPLVLKTPPPGLPDEGVSFWERFRRTRDFLGYFDEITTREERLLGQYDLTLFVYFYDHSDTSCRRIFSRFDSLASWRSRLGIIVAPVKRKLPGNTGAVVAHELGHIRAASDKYRDGSSLYPKDFADPAQQPRSPRDKAEIMAPGRPAAVGVDQPVNALRECVVGDETAREMNWRVDA